MDIVALAAELTAGHPVTGAYNADDALAAGELNAVNRTRSRDTVTGSEILIVLPQSYLTGGARRTFSSIWSGNII